VQQKKQHVIQSVTIKLLVAFFVEPPGLFNLHF